MAGDPTTVSAVAGDAKPPLTLVERLIVFDAALSLLLHDLFRSLPRPILKTLEISGDGRLWFPISISLLPFSSSLFLSLLLGLLLDISLVGALKFLVRRPRPVYNRNMTLVVAVDHWSFPSGHSSRVFFAASFLYLVGGAGAGVVAAVFVWAAVTAVSRVLMGRHFVMDVVAGAGLGAVEGIITHRFLKF